MPSGDGFLDSREHLLAELAWVELRLQREVVLARAERRSEARDEFAGMYVSDAEIDRYLSTPRPDVAPDPVLGEWDAGTTAARATIDNRVRGAVRAGVYLRLPALVATFDLSDAEADILLYALAPDFDERFTRYYAYLQNDVAWRRPTARLLARLVDHEHSLVATRVLFGSDAPLWRHRLVRWAANDVPSEDALPGRTVAVAPSIVDYLLQIDRLDAPLADVAALEQGQPLSGEGGYARRPGAIVTELVGLEETLGRLPLTYVSGASGAGKHGIAAAVAFAGARSLLRISLPKLLATADSARELLALARRDALLRGSLVHLEGCESLLDEHERTRQAAGVLEEFLREGDVAVVLTGTAAYGEVKRVLGLPLRSLDLPPLTIEERCEIWAQHLEGPEPDQDRAALGALATRFRFTPGQIQAVVASLVPGESGTASLENVLRRCREESGHGLLGFARQIVPRATWTDIVLPADVGDQLREICAGVTHRRTVSEQWGFGAHANRGRGHNILFAGVSGTGKSTCSEIIAGELGLDLYQIDLSCVVSKWVGETERNLSRIFREAEASNAILFFDEADALFGRRSEVKDAHDRYANIEVGYLLQKLDDHDGMVILATNLKKNLDPAFTRRLAHVVEFPFPGPELRERIWRIAFPPAVPLTPDVDFGFLSRHFKLSGGNIHNIALGAAFLAAANGGCVTMENVVRATKREYQKMGKLCSRADFGEYYELVRDEHAA